MFTLSLQVPNSSVPALIGLEGSKVRDTNLVTGTSSAIRRHRDDDTASIVVTGDNYKDVTSALEIWRVALLHYEAAVAPKENAKSSRPDVKCVLFDLIMFKFEINKYST